MHKDESKDFLKTLQPMGKMADVTDVVDAVLYLAGTSSERGGTPRRWRCSRWPLVAAPGDRQPGGRLT
jgi:hypothetical protein